MWTHVSDDALMDLVDGTAAPRALSHVAACRRCQGRVEEARSGLALVAAAEVPEPTPLYWQVLRREVGRRIADDRPRLSPRPRWAAVGVAAAAVIAALSLLPGHVAVGPGTAAAAPLPAWSALPPASEDAALPLLESIAPTVASAAPAAVCPDLTECVAGLSDEESRALADVLRDEIAQGNSL